MRARIQAIARFFRRGGNMQAAAFLALAVSLAAPAVRADPLWVGLQAACIDAFEDPETAEPVKWDVVRDPYGATNTFWNKRLYVYKGFIHLDGPCWFAEQNDESTLLKIDGQVLIRDEGENAWYGLAKGKFTGEEGWHDFELRQWNLSGQGGAHQTCSQGFLCAFGMSKNEPGSMADCDYPVDPGDGSLFRYGERPDVTKDGLLIAVSPEGLPIACDPPLGWKAPLRPGDEVICSATNSCFRNGTHYKRLGKISRATWNDTLTNEYANGTWDSSSEEATETLTGTYKYTHGQTIRKAVRITWLYEADGYQLRTGVFPPGAGAVEPSFPPDLSDGCYASNRYVTLTARPGTAAFRFAGWLDGDTPSGALDTNASHGVRMDRVREVRAVFRPALLTWAGGAGGGAGGDGGVWRDGGGGWLSEGGAPADWADGAAAVFTGAVPVRAVIDAGGVRASSVRFDGAAPVALEGGPLTLFGDARLVATNAADVVLNVVLAGVDGLTIVHGTKAAFGDASPETGAAAFLPGARLEEIALIEASAGEGMPGGGPAPCIPCQDRLPGDGGGRSIQFQALDGDGEGGGVTTRFVRVLFTQEGGGVAARRPAGHGPAGGWLPGNWIGTDMDREEGAAGAEYGVSNLVAQVAPGRFVIGRPTAFSGPLTLERGRLEFGPEGRLGADGVFLGAVTNNGLFFTPPVWQAFEGRVEGAGRFVSAGGAPGGREGFIPGPLEKGREYTVVETNGSLDSLAGVFGYTGGDAFSAGNRGILYPFAGFETNNAATNIAVHLQIHDYATPDDCHTKGVRIQLYARPGGRIVAVYDKSYFYANTNRIGCFPGGEDPQPEDAGYEVRRLHVSLGRGARSVFRDAAWTGGLAARSNGVVSVETETGLPPAGTLEAASGGEIRCYARAAHPNPVSLRPGGILTLSPGHVYSPFDGVRKLFLEGGILRTPSGSPDDSENYVNHLDVLNGGTVEGAPCRAAHAADAVLKVRGRAPCRQAAGIRLMGGDAARTLTLDVDDVTGDGQGDLFIGGNITGENTGIVKTGPGTAVFSGKNSYSGCETRIDAGTLRFETDQAVRPAGNRIVLNGDGEDAPCALDIGPCTNAVCPLALEGKGGALIIRDGGQISFASSAEAVWAPGASLLIDGRLGERTVRFGEDDQGLTAGQLGRIRLKGWKNPRLRLTQDGWLNVPKVSVIIFR